MTAANPVRGETEIRIGGRSYVLRPTLDLLARIEEEFGGIYAIVRRFQGGELVVADAVGILARALATTEHPPARTAIEAMAESEGIHVVYDGLARFLARAIRGSAADQTTDQATEAAPMGEAVARLRTGSPGGE